VSDKETAPPLRPYMDRLLKKLADPSEAFHYVKAAWQESPEVFIQAVKDVAQAVAVECTTPAPQPQQLANAYVQCAAERDMWKAQYEKLAATPQVTPTDAAPAPQTEIRNLLIRALVEICYMHSAEVLELVKSAEGESIIEEGMKLLGLKDLSDEELARVRATPQVTPTLVQGSWPENCPQRNFVEGASWWQFHSQGSTMFASERDEAEAEAVKRFGPVEGTSEQASPTQLAESDTRKDSGREETTVTSSAPTSWTEEELDNFGKLATQVQPAPTEHLIRAMASEQASPTPEWMNEVVEVRKGFGTFDMASLAGDEFVAASGLRDAGWIVYRKKVGEVERG
jgi:hypothetical protein